MHFLSPLRDFQKHPTKRALYTLLLGLFPILLALLLLLYTGISARAGGGGELLLWLHLLPGALDSVAISLFLLLIGAFLLDLSEKTDGT